jgi:hypothetical protein
LLAFTITMNRIITLRLQSGHPGRLQTDAHQEDEWGFAAPTTRMELFPR